MGVLHGLLFAFLQADPEGRPEDLLQYRICKVYKRSDGVDESLESMALASPRFGTRYAATLLQIHKAFANGRGFERAYQAIQRCSPVGGPPGAAEHLKALEASFRQAVYCPDCKGGKVTCTQCQGKGRVERFQCAVCSGKGRIVAAGAQLGSTAQIKCRNCEGLGVFKNAGCPGCSRSGLARCASCNGNPWHDTCSNTACKDGKVPCSTCAGKGIPGVDCSYCQNGRVPAPGAQLGSNAQMKCRICDGKGQVKANCTSCSKTGRVPCESCQERKKGGKGEASLVSSVFTTAACGECSGTGWPEAGKALACRKCVGLGVKIVPAVESGKVFE